MRQVVNILIFCFSMLAFNIQADMFKPTPYCTKPSKPYSFDNEWQVKQYYDSIDRYKKCIADFVEKQNRESLNHQKAAADAIDEWNRFVRYELN